jgi:hypothetical protein
MVGGLIGEFSANSPQKSGVFRILVLIRANLAEMTHNALRGQKHIKRGKNHADVHSHRLESL